MMRHGIVLDVAGIVAIVAVVSLLGPLVLGALKIRTRSMKPSQLRPSRPGASSQCVAQRDVEESPMMTHNEELAELAMTISIFGISYATLAAILYTMLR